MFLMLFVIESLAQLVGVIVKVIPFYPVLSLKYLVLNQIGKNDNQWEESATRPRWLNVQAPVGTGIRHVWGSR